MWHFTHICIMHKFCTPISNCVELIRFAARFRTICILSPLCKTISTRMHSAGFELLSSSLRTKLMMRYIFVILRFPISRTFFKVGTLPSFCARWRCKWSYHVVHRHFTIPRHHYFDYSSSPSTVKRAGMNVSGHPVYV